jgi:hypothetical protein
MIGVQSIQSIRGLQKYNALCRLQKHKVLCYLQKYNCLDSTFGSGRGQHDYGEEGAEAKVQSSKLTIYSPFRQA